MMKQSGKKAVFAILTALAGTAICAPVVQAESYNRGTANTDLMFDDFEGKTFKLYLEYGTTMPSRTFDTLMGSAVDLPAYSDDFDMPSFALAAKVSDTATCVLTYAKPFGADATYSEAAQNAEYATAVANGIDANPTSETSFIAKEYGATCAYKVPMGPGNFYVIGGTFYQTFEYEEATWVGTVHLKDKGKWGYRLGAAYEIPEIAGRVELLYRSAIDQSGSGSFKLTDLGIGYGFPDDQYSTGAGTMPQSLTLSVQSGIAPEWLAFGAFKWTDWSVLPHFTYNVDNVGASYKVFNYRDGYTLDLGLGHQFTPKLSGAVLIEWDRGVGTGADLATDTWTLGLNAEYATGYGTFGVSCGLSLLTAGSQSDEQGAVYDATSDDDTASFIGFSYSKAF